MPDSFLAFRGITKSFGSKEVLRGVDLAVNPQECMVILGGSGSGKSVLLKTSIGLLRPDEGQVLLEGEEIQNLNESEFAPVRARISYVFQLGALFDSMDVFNNLAFPLRVQTDMGLEEIRERVAESLERVNLGGTEELMPSDLSGGMRKRVALARGIITQPECILYDEPTAGLDPVTANQINELILRMQEDLNVTSIVVTHDIPCMDMIADRVAFLYEGKMDYVGRPADARSREAGKIRGFIEGVTDECQV